MVPHCGFDLHFSDKEWCWASFHVFVSHLYVFFGDMSIYFFGPILDWVVYFSGIALQELLVYFWDELFVSCFIYYYFLHSECCLFTLFIVSFVVQNIFLYTSSVYSCHLFLISTAPVRSMWFQSFIEPIFAWNVPLVSLIFLSRLIFFPILLFSSISFHWSLRKAFLSLLALLW